MQTATAPGDDAAAPVASVGAGASPGTKRRRHTGHQRTWLECLLRTTIRMDSQDVSLPGVESKLCIVRRADLDALLACATNALAEIPADERGWYVDDPPY